MIAGALAHSWFLLAEAPDAPKVVYELARLRDVSDPGTFALLTALVMLALLASVGTIYWRDSRELSTVTSLSLLGLRCVALVGLLVFFLGPEKRTMHQVVRNSQVVILADVSQSMGQYDSTLFGIDAASGNLFWWHQNRLLGPARIGNRIGLGI